jgi:iron complex outermembrane receptor protein
MSFPLSSRVASCGAAAMLAALLHPACASAEEGATVLEEITVQGEGGGSGPRLERKAAAASRLGLTVKETPATVDVIDQEEIQQRGLRSLIEVYRDAPGVVAGNLPGEPGVTAIRGFSRGAVGYSIDGVRAIDPLIASRNYDSFSFDRVEILKGPASVVSGSGALAGTINLVTRKPELGVTKAEGLLSYGSFDTVRAGAAFTAPISENAAASASVLYGRSSGYVNDTDSENVQVTTGLTLKPTDRLTLTAAFDYFRDDFSTAYFGTPLLPRGVARDPSGVVSGAVDGLDYVLDKSIRRKNYNVDDGVMKSDAIWARTGAEFQLTDQWTLKNDFAFYSADRLWRNSEDYTYDAATGKLNRGLTYISHDQQSWTNRTSANFDGEIGGMRNRFTAGFEYMRTEFGSKRRFDDTYKLIDPVDPFSFDRGRFPDTSGFETRQNFDSTVDNTALFVENALNVTPDWIVVAGLRQDFIDLDRSIDDLVDPAKSDKFGNKYSPTTWRLGTVYDLTPEVSLFGQYTTAITPASALVLSSATRAGLDLTTGRSIEAGVKASLLDGRLVATGSVYQIEQHDIIRTYPGGVTEQGGDQRSRGVEFDVSFAVTEQWKINGNASLLKAEFTKLTETVGDDEFDRKGNRPLNAPEQTFNLWTTYRLASAPITFGAGLRHVGNFYTDNANTIRVDGRTLLDASIAWDVPAGGTLTLRGRNLTDKFYAEWSGYSSTQVYVGAPRSFDLTYALKF